MKFLESIFNNSKKIIKKINPIINSINGFEHEISKLNDSELVCKTMIFKEKLAKGETLDCLLPEAFAVVREVSKRVLGMRHFDVQLIGGIILHQGHIAEMKTGEGKTLVATLPVYLNALKNEGVHVITVNDYLAKRDSEWMGSIYKFLNLNVGLLVNDTNHFDRKKQYHKDITYGTNNEFGFDYLRDNMAISKDLIVQKKLNFAIIDEVDSILIDEARTPLIISGEADKPTDMYRTVEKVVSLLKRNKDFTTEEKQRLAVLTDEGLTKVEQMLNINGIYENNNFELGHHINQSLVAHFVMKKNVDYIVKNEKIVIVDQFTGRLMYGRRYSNGLHQAIEAKEKVNIQKESQTLATITFQNYFRMYKKLSGMTGTAKTEENEFSSIYGVNVIEIPTNVLTQREDLDDIIFRTEKGKFKAIALEIGKCYKEGQPILVGTISIDKSEFLSNILYSLKIPHQVLNAKYHEKEAEIIAKAGEKYSVTIATNMAGRGTDIILGKDVKSLGGLFVIGSERHESRRIDNQLRGRSGRQGDPGKSQFFISSEDDLLRIYGGEKIQNLLRITTNDDIPIDNILLTKSIERAQKSVENRNFETRKQVLEYDNIMNKQREIIYSQRRDVLFSNNLKNNILSMLEDVIKNVIYRFSNSEDNILNWDLDGLLIFSEQTFLPKTEIAKKDLLNLSNKEIKQMLKDKAIELYEKKESSIGFENMRFLEKQVILNAVDNQWTTHIDSMDQLRQGIGLRAYGQKNPLTEYKFESYEMFQFMIENIKEEVIFLIFRANLVKEENSLNSIKENNKEFKNENILKKKKKIGRNDLCDCGSKKKYKYCCGR